MDEKLISLSFSVEANKGVYALLLGSGISHSAGIPTGWGILKELCKRIMQLQGDSENDEIEWYKNKYGKEPLYDEVIALLGQTSSERLGLLEEFFIPSEDERNQGLKVPTLAHRSIAKLVKEGYIKVIITTNFDRLLEQAMEEENVQYQTLYHESDIQGMKPFMHSACTIIKVHGDYRDTRFKNVTEELVSYPDELNSVLDDVFDSFGLIVSGWSSEWDTALRESIKKVQARRYSWYWHSFSQEINPSAKELINFRDGSVIVDSEGADHFFKNLLENILSISEMKKVNPDNILLKISSMKRYLRNNDEISIRDMITEETKILMDFTEDFAAHGQVSRETLMEYVNVTMEKSKSLALLMFLLAFNYDSKAQKELLIETFERLTSKKSASGNTLLLSIRDLPLQIVFYNVGISLVKRKDYAGLETVFTVPKVRDRLHKRNDFLRHTSPYRGLRELFQNLHSEKNWFLPMEEVLYPYLSNILKENGLVFDEEESQIHYDIFEFLRCIKIQYLYRDDYVTGRFGYKYERDSLEKFLLKGSENPEWEVLEITGKSQTEFQRALAQLVEKLNRHPNFSGDGLLESYPLKE